MQRKAKGKLARFFVRAGTRISSRKLLEISQSQSNILLKSFLKSFIEIIED